MSHNPITEIDHLMTYVYDLDAAASLFGRMGFTLSPISRIEPMGISNHLVLMHPAAENSANFIELMAAHDRSLLPPAMVRTLSGSEGIKSMVLSADDAMASYDLMRAQGYDVSPPVHVKREWILGPDESVFPEFDVVLPPDTPLGFNCCKYFNVSLYRRDKWLSHPNGARRLRAVLAVADNPANVAGQFEALFGRRADSSNGSMRVSPGTVELQMMSAAHVKEHFGLDVGKPEKGAFYLGYVIEVTSLDRVRSCLESGAVEYRAVDNAILVDPSIAFGNLIVFSPEGSRP